MDDDIPLCPPWWPKFIWDAEWHPHPHPHRPGGGGGNPVNFPPYIDDVLVALTVNVLTYRLADQQRAADIRALTVETISTTAKKLTGHPAEREQALEA